MKILISKIIYLKIEKKVEKNKFIKLKFSV
jgi:hypothetical protein